LLENWPRNQDLIDRHFARLAKASGQEEHAAAYEKSVEEAGATERYEELVGLRAAAGVRS
jgi:hypothetical protein